MFTLNTADIGQSFLVYDMPFEKAYFHLSSPVQLHCSKQTQFVMQDFTFFWKYRRLSLNFDKFLCPFTSSPWGFYAHSFILSAVTSWGREACSGIRDSALTFSYKSNWLPSELCSSDIANGQLEVIDIQLVFHSQRRRLKISNGTDCLFFKRLIMHIHKILLDKEDMPSSFNSP